MKTYNQFINEAHQAKQSLDENILKLAARVLPGLQTVYGLGLGAYRLAKGDPLGASLAAASAIPGPAGWAAFAADTAREFGAGQGTPFGKKDDDQAAKPSGKTGSQSGDSQIGKTRADGKVWAGKDLGWQNPQTVWKHTDPGTTIGQEMKLPGSLGTKYWTGKDFGWQTKATLEKQAGKSGQQTPDASPKPSGTSQPPKPSATPQQPSASSEPPKPSDKPQQPSTPPEPPKPSNTPEQPSTPPEPPKPSQQPPTPPEPPKPSEASRPSKKEEEKSDTSSNRPVGRDEMIAANIARASK